MSAEKVTQLEREVAGIQVMLPSLMKKMDESTETQKELTRTNIELSHDIKTLISSSKEVNDRLNNHESRIVELEAKDRIRDSDSQSTLWIKRAAITTITSIVIGAIVYIVKVMP